MQQNKPFTVTVSQLNRKIALMLKSEKTFTDLCVRGEISDFTLHYKSGHMYFSLKDEACSVKAVMFRSYAENLSFIPENGMSVVVRGSVQCYEKDGIYQIYASDIIPDGIGAQVVAFEQLKAKLEKEGLFSQKRPLPRFPEKICVITAETGAALQDIINILSRRYPVCKVVLIPVLVQGEKAPDSIVNAFSKAGKTGADLIIFGRGGGSSDDLSAFNSEQVVRAVFESSIPTISAVGHETDFSLSDFAADLRAPTPSAAAELAVPDIKELSSTLNAMFEYIKRLSTQSIERRSVFLKLMQKEIQSRSPINKLITQEKLILDKENFINGRINVILKEKEQALSEKSAVISALNPLAVLMRGYSIVYKDEKALISEKDAKKGDKIRIRLADGEINAIIE